MAKLEYAAQGAGQRIKRIRKSNGYTMEAFGKLFNPPASKGLVRNWEHGDNLPSKDRLEKIAEIGNTTVDEIKYGTLSEYVGNVINHYLTTHADPEVFNAYTTLKSQLSEPEFDEVYDYLIVETTERCRKIDARYGDILLIESLFRDAFKDYIQAAKASPINQMIERINEILPKLNEDYLTVVKNYTEHQYTLQLGNIIRYEFQSSTGTASIAEDGVPYYASDEIDFPFYGSVSAGTGEYLQDEHAEPITVQAASVPTNADYCLRVNGDSMLPMFENGDIIFVHKQQEPSDGAIMIVDVDGEAYVKKVRVENNQLRLVSLNPAYDDIIVNNANDMRIMGKVVFK